MWYQESICPLRVKIFPNPPQHKQLNNEGYVISLPNYNQRVFSQYKSGGYESISLFPCTLIELYLIDVFDQFQFGRVFSHVFMQGDECVVFTIWEHKDRNLGL